MKGKQPDPTNESEIQYDELVAPFNYAWRLKLASTRCKAQTLTRTNAKSATTPLIFPAPLEHFHAHSFLNVVDPSESLAFGDACAFCRCFQAPGLHCRMRFNGRMRLKHGCDGANEGEDERLGAERDRPSKGHSAKRRQATRACSTCIMCGHSRTEALALAFRWEQAQRRKEASGAKRKRKRKNQSNRDDGVEGEDDGAEEERIRREQEMRLTLRREAKARAHEARVMKKKERRQRKLQRKAEEERQKKLQHQRDRIRGVSPSTIQPATLPAIKPGLVSISVAIDSKVSGAGDANCDDAAGGRKKKKKKSDWSIGVISATNNSNSLVLSGKDLNSEKSQSSGNNAQKSNSMKTNSVVNKKDVVVRESGKSLKPMNNNAAPLSSALSASQPGKKRDFSQFDMPVKQKANAAAHHSTNLSSQSQSNNTQPKKRKTIQEMLEEKKAKEASGSLFQSFL
jgi:hypothetical protein